MRKNVMEALTETDMEVISSFKLTDDETAHIISLLELVPEEGKEAALNTLKGLFEGKELVSVKDVEVEEKAKKKSSIAERYTKILLGDK